MTDTAARLRVRLLVPFLGTTLLALVVVGGVGGWLGGWFVERSFDRGLGDKLELAAAVLDDAARAQLAQTRRLAAGGTAEDGALEILPPARQAAHHEAIARVGREGYTVVAAPEGFFILAVAERGGGGSVITSRRLSGEVLERFRSLGAADMALFADWQRSAVAAFAVDLRECRNCHEPDWRVRHIASRFHTERSFKGRRFFAASLGDGFRYAFAPLELGGRRVGMLVVRQTLDTVAAARRQMTLALTVGAAAVLLLTLATWWRLSHRITRSLASLQRWMEAFAEEPTGPPPHHVTVRDGVDALTDSLTATVGALRESRDRIERQKAELQAMLVSQSSVISSMEQRLVTLTGLAEASERVPEPEDVSGEVLRQVLRLVGAPAGRLVFLEPAADDMPQCLDLGADGIVVSRAFDHEHDSMLLSAARRSRLPFHVGPELVAGAGATGSVAVPLTLRGHTFGVLVLAERPNGSPYGEWDMETLSTLAHQAAMALEHAFLYRRAQDAYLHTTGVLVTTIEEKDPYLRGHGDRVSRLAVATAATLGLTNGDLRRLALLGRFHDVGKICIDSSVLLKPGRLTADEYAAIKRHAEIGEAIVGQITSLRDSAFVIGQHHERVDGTGYPRGIGGDEISLQARIIAVCDSFDAMTSARPYRAARAARPAADEVGAVSGAQFDPRVVEAFRASLADGGGPVIAEVTRS